MIHDAVHSHTSSLSISRSVSLTLSSVLFDLLDSDGALVVALGSDEEDDDAGDYGTGRRRGNGDLPPPTAPRECPRLWLRVLAKAVPLRMSGMSGGGRGGGKGREGRGGWGGTNEGEGADDEGEGEGEGEGEEEDEDSSRFQVLARVKFPIPHTPQWAIRFVVRTMAPIIVGQVRHSHSRDTVHVTPPFPYTQPHFLPIPRPDCRDWL